jgi:hypothetical protein
MPISGTRPGLGSSCDQSSCTGLVEVRAAETARREARRKLVAEARENAEVVTRDGSQFRLIRLAPEVGPQRVEEHRQVVADKQPLARIIA